MPFVFTSNTLLQTAVAAWIINGTNNSAAAVNAYGNEHISLWNVSAITDMSNLFMNRTAFDDNISGWNVSNVTNMSNMFNSARVFNALIGVWNVSNVRNMSGMFAGSQYTNIPLNAWNVRNVTNMTSMFSGCTRYDQNIRAWPVGSATILTNMFNGATAMINNQLAPVTPGYNTWFNQNVLPTGSVTIAGTLIENQVLTASHTLADVNGPALLTVSYQWKRSLSSTVAGSNILLNATSSTYRLVPDDVGKYITVTASYTDGLGNNESVTSASTADVAVFVPIPIDTRAQLDVAVASWISNPTISNPYGPINSWNVSAITDMSTLFTAKTTFNSDISGWNVSNVTNMQSMFDSAFAFNQPLNAWNVSNVTNMESMFRDNYVFNQPLNTWNVLKVTNMRAMFRGAYVFNQNISSWNVRNVTDMVGMFINARAFNWNIRGWYVGQTTLLTEMFAGADAMLATPETIATPPYTYFTQLPVNVLPTGSVTIAGTPTQNQILTASHTLADANGPVPLTVSYKWKRGLTSTVAGSEILNATGSTYTLVSDDVGKYITVTASYTDGLGTPESVTSAATAVIALFVPLPTGTRAQLDAAITSWISDPTLSNPYGPIHTWNVSAVTDMSNLFLNKSTFNSDISAWNMSNVIRTEAMFQGATAFNQPIGSWNVSNVTSMAFMFYNTVAFNQPLNSWIVSKVTTMSNMFRNTQFNQPLNSWNVSQVTTLSSMFRNTPFNQPLNSWNVSNVLFAVDMFRDAVTFNQNIRGWDLGPAVDLTTMFSGATAMLLNQTAIATPLYSYFTPVNKPPTGAVIIAGTPTQHYVLTADKSGISNGNNGMGAFSYQWKRSLSSTVAGSNILLNATGSTYTLVSDDIGKYITVTASYTDGLGNNESVTSASTAAVAVFVALPTGNRTQLEAAITSWISNPTLSNPYGPINTWNVSAITDMSNLFNGKSTFNSDISAWNVSNVTNMAFMFLGSTVFNQPLNSWIVSKVTSMQNMFNNTAFNQPLNSWNVSMVTNMGSMFKGASSFNQPLTSWNMSNALNISEMFRNAVAFNQNIRGWDIGPAVDLNLMFSGATAMLGTPEAIATPLYSYFTPVNKPTTGSVTIAGTLTENQLLTATTSGISNGNNGVGAISYQWKRSLSSTVAGSNILLNATSSTYRLVPDDVGKYITVTASYTDGLGNNESVTSASTAAVAVFVALPTGTRAQLDAAVTSWISNPTLSNPYGPINSWNVSAITDMSTLFTAKTTFNSDISAWNVSNVTNMESMFNTALAFNQPLNTWNVSNVTNMENMFRDNYVFNQPLDTWNVLKVTNMRGMFRGAYVFNQNISGWNVRNVTDMIGMFTNARAFNWNIRGWYVGQTTLLTEMFAGADAMLTTPETIATPPYTYFTPLPVNVLPTGSVTIAGTPMQNQILTASHTLADANGPVPLTVSYKWKRGLTSIVAGSEILNATGSTYTLVSDDIGKYITVTASYTDSLGNNESVTSAATAVIAVFVPLPTDTRAQLDAAITSWISNPTISNPYGPINTWNVSAVTDMANLFNGKSTFNSDISAWNMSNVIRTEAMFSGALAFNQPIGSWNVSKVTSMAFMFYNTVASAFNQPLNSWIVSKVTNMTNMFRNTPFNQPLNSWNVSRVTNMSSMFRNTPFNQPLNSWNVSNVLFAIDMFRDAVYFNQDIRGWDLGPVVDLTTMFSGATAMLTNPGTHATPLYSYFTPVNKPPTGAVIISGTSTQNQVLTATTSGISNGNNGMGAISYQWKRGLSSNMAGSNILLNATSSTYTLGSDDIGKYITVTASYTDGLGNNESVTSASTAVIAAFVPLPTGTRSQLNAAVTSWISNPTLSNPYGPINAWNVSAITDMSYLFQYKPTFNSDISAWNVSNVTNMHGMFQGAIAFNQPLNSWDVSKVVIMSKMFNYASSFNQPLNSWIVSNAVYMGEMFSRATSFDQSIGAWNVSKVADMNNMFLGATEFNQPLDSWNVIQLTNTSNMFCAATKFNQPLGSWNVSNVTEMGAMFSGATAFNQPLDSWNVSKVKNMTNMFMNNAIFNQPLNSWIVSQVTTMQNMFNGTAAFNQPLNSWNLRQVNNLSGMFAGATSFDQPLDSWNVSNVNTMSNMFLNAPVFNRNIRGWYVGQSTLLSGMFSGATAMLANQEASATPPHAYFNQAIQYIPPNGGVLITGTAEQGTSLTASNTFEDPDGVGTVYYQWIRDGSAILEAINSTWTLTAADVGKLITVTATYVDGLGKTKRSTSPATNAVGNVNDPVVGYVMIDGDLTQGQTLTASHTLTDDDGLGAVSYKWLQNGSIINGAVNPTYILTPDDIGAKISVMASYKDNGGRDESKTSVETFKIQPLRAAYSLLTKGIETMSLRTPVNGNIIIADAAELVVTSSNNTGAISTMTSVENQAWIKHNVSALLAKYTPSLGSDKLYISKSLLPFAVTSPIIAAVELIDAKSSSVASPLVRVGDASMGAFYIDTQPGNSVTLTYSPDTVVITHISESAFTVAINGGAAVNKLVGDKILLKNVVLTLGSITGEPNNPPVFVQNAPTTVYAGASYSYTVSVSDADNDTFTVTAPILPSWLTFNQVTGTLSSSSVPSSVVGYHDVQLLAQDIWGGKTYYDFTITVQNVPVTGTVGDAIKFVLPALNAGFELTQALSILGEYTAPDAYALPTITLSMPASQFNGGLFQLELTDSNIDTLANPATEAVYHSEKITYYADQNKFPELKNTANVLLKDLPVVNGAAALGKRLRQRNAETDRLAASMVHELAYQAIGVSLMDDQLDNGTALKASIDQYLTVALPAFVKVQLANCDGKTQNINAVTDSEGRDNVPRELFMQIVESCVGGGTTGGQNAKSSRLNSLFEASNLAEGKYGIKFITGDSLRFSITIAPHSENGVVQDIDYIVDGHGHPVQEARTVELIISMT